MANAKIVLTDSGGIQEETTCLGVSCITLRDNTERPVTIEQGTNILAGTEKDRILASFHSLLGKANSKVRPKYWDGAAAERIVDILVRLVRKKTVP
jgi:UDP-N-acetylglucosamine 2-epimerase (non-hydrolysing)